MTPDLRKSQRRLIVTELWIVPLLWFCAGGSLIMALDSGIWFGAVIPVLAAITQTVFLNLHVREALRPVAP